jgi:hypothetical protein
VNIVIVVGHRESFSIQEVQIIVDMMIDAMMGVMDVMGDV